MRKALLVLSVLFTLPISFTYAKVDVFNCNKIASSISKGKIDNYYDSPDITLTIQDKKVNIKYRIYDVGDTYNMSTDYQIISKDNISVKAIEKKGSYEFSTFYFSYKDKQYSLSSLTGYYAQIDTGKCF
jgi:hypothetical protein